MKGKCLLLLLIVQVLLVPASPSFPGDEIYEDNLNRGITNAEVYAYQLIQSSREQPDKAAGLLSRALQGAPNLPLVYFAKAKDAFALSGEGILESLDFLLNGVDSYTRNFWWSFSLYEALFFSFVLSLILSVVLVVVLRLFLDMPLISHDMSETPSKTLLLAGLIVLSLVSPLFFLAGILILLGLYMRKTDRAVVYIFLLFLALSPWTIRTASLFISASLSGKAKAIVQVNESRGNAYALSALENGTDFPARFSYALALKREGTYEEAADILLRLTGEKKDPRALVNLGNCYIGLNNFEEAGSYYSAALEIRPVAAAYYNLSQISRELLDFNKGDEYFMAAVSLDRVAVSGYRAMYSRTPNRLVADETLSRAELWEYVMGNADPGRTFNLSIVPLPVLSLLALALAGGFFWLCGHLRHTAYRCRKCGVILCTQCEKHIMWGQMCPQCYGSLVKLEEMDVRERVARLLSIHEQLHRRRGIMKILSFVLPGTAFIYAGRILPGLVMLWFFLFFLMVPVMNGIITMGDALISHGLMNGIALCAGLVVYAASYGITKRRMAKGWL